jgi:IclR family acetate operon transcriptional repressor
VSNAGGAPIESVDRALRLVELLWEADSLGITDVAERLGVPPSTAHRLLSALIHRGFAVKADGRRYRAGPVLETRRHGRHRSVETLRELLSPALELLQRRTGETAQLMVRQGSEVRYVYGIEPDEPLRVTARFGDLMPAYVASGGKVLLSELDEAELDRLYAGGLPPWPTARIDDLAGLKEQLAEVRRVGYALNLEETEAGVCGVAVAAHDPAGRGVAALVVAVPSVRFAEPDLPRCLEALEEARELAEEQLRP